MAALDPVPPKTVVAQKWFEGPGLPGQPTQEDEAVLISAPDRLRRGVRHFRPFDVSDCSVSNHAEACIAKAHKATAVAEITEQFKGSSATLVPEYRGLTVANLKDLRRWLGDFATYTVAKNTLS